MLILDRDVPVARLEPVVANSLPDDLRMAALARQGLIRGPREPGSLLEALGKLPLPRLKPGRSAVAAVVSERGEGR